MKYALPLAVFLGIAAFLLVGLERDPGLLPSALLDKPAPSFDTGRLYPGNQLALDASETGRISNKMLEGSVWVLNIWASWCVACVTEHPLVTELAAQTGVMMVGLNYKDQDDEARAWLARFGNPYTAVALDNGGQIGIDYGVYGVPETYIVDKQGVIRHKHVGPIDADAMNNLLIPTIKKLMAGPA